MSIALVPIKSLQGSKSRLERALTREQVEALSLAMLGDVVEALRAAKSVTRVAVVTPDPAVARHARELGAEAWEIATPGLNPSLEAATARALRDGEPSLIVLGDVAGIEPGDVDALHAALPGRGVALAPSADGGTSALLRDPADAIPCRFGPDSAAAHRQAAWEAGVEFIEIELDSLSIDVDRPEDLGRFLERGSGGRRTRALLAHMDDA